MSTDVELRFDSMDRRIGNLEGQSLRQMFVAGISGGTFQPRTPQIPIRRDFGFPAPMTHRLRIVLQAKPGASIKVKFKALALLKQ